MAYKNKTILRQSGIGNCQTKPKNRRASRPPQCNRMHFVETVNDTTIRYIFLLKILSYLGQRVKISNVENAISDLKLKPLGYTQAVKAASAKNQNCCLRAILTFLTVHKNSY